MKWLRSLAGVGVAALNLFANGTNWKQILLSSGLAALGVVLHLTGLQSDMSMPGRGKQSVLKQ
jgi:hypothetical protein